jgi:hypothetical protein
VDRVVLQRLEGWMASEVDLPAHQVEVLPGGTVRYYRPLLVVPMCVTCHGPRESLPDEVQRLLAERYPEDAATGYGPGELRGVIRVTLPDGFRE